MLVYYREYTEAELWENYERFLEELLPVVEEVRVKLCLHPNDPPVQEKLGRAPMLFRDLETFERAMNHVPSESHGLEFRPGCWSQMGKDVEEGICHFGGEKLFYVHFGDAEGTVLRFHETFVDEGNYDAYEVVKLLDEVGFSGPMIPDHTPHLNGDTDWDHRGRIHAVGYLRGLLDAVHRE